MLFYYQAGGKLDARCLSGDVYQNLFAKGNHEWAPSCPNVNAAFKNGLELSELRSAR